MTQRKPHQPFTVLHRKLAALRARPPSSDDGETWSEWQRRQIATEVARQLRAARIMPAKPYRPGGCG